MWMGVRVFFVVYPMGENVLLPQRPSNIEIMYFDGKSKNVRLNLDNGLLTSSNVSWKETM